jgi:hypothetical protein
MMPDRVVSLIADHSLAVVASAAGTITGLGFAVGQLPVPDGVPSWLPVLVSFLTPVISIVGVRLLSAWAASRRSLAESKERRAKQLLADNDKANDAEAHRLQDEADALRAQADAADAAGRKR